MNTYVVTTRYGVQWIWAGESPEAAAKSFAEAMGEPAAYVARMAVGVMVLPRQAA